MANLKRTQTADDSIPTRQSLLRRLKDWGDEGSWREFFDTYWRLIYNVAVQAGLTDAEAQDVVQETMLTVARIMPKFEYNPAVGSFKGFLLHTVRWRIHDQFRKRMKEVSVPSLALEEGTGTEPLARVADPKKPPLDKMWETEWEKWVFETAIEKVKQRVNPKHYQLFDLVVNKGWSVEEITSTLEVTPHEVYKAKSRIAAKIQEEVQRLRERMKE